jgi:hypothetical protein
MALDRRRFTRQIRLVEVGEAGQARIAAATVGLASSGYAREIEERYLLAAGITPVGDRPPEMSAEVLGLRNAAAREVGQGAFHALLAFRRALAIETAIGSES